MDSKGSPDLNLIKYDRIAALDYTHQWSFDRNPLYYNFDGLGGDCTNFASQVLFSGMQIMNFNPIFGWYFRNLGNRTPSWTGVDFLYNFLITNKSNGPFGNDVDSLFVEPGDILQLSLNKTGGFQHSLIIVETGEPVHLENILVAAHTLDADYKPLVKYKWERIRFISIVGARKIG